MDDATILVVAADETQRRAALASLDRVAEASSCRIEAVLQADAALQVAAQARGPLLVLCTPAVSGLTSQEIIAEIEAAYVGTLLRCHVHHFPRDTDLVTMLDSASDIALQVVRWQRPLVA